MHVADFESGAVTIQTAWPEGGQAAFVGQFGQRICLVHELAQLTAAEEVTHEGGQGFRIDEFGWGHALDIDVEQGHAFFDEAFGAAEADPALIGEQFTHGPHAAGAEVVDVVEQTVAIF